MQETLDAWRIQIDEKKELVAVTEEFLLDRTKRFENYRSNYIEQREDFDEHLRICRALLDEKKHDSDKEVSDK